MKPENASFLGKGNTSSKPPFLGSMLIFVSFLGVWLVVDIFQAASLQVILPDRGIMDSNWSNQPGFA